MAGQCSKRRYATYDEAAMVLVNAKIERAFRRRHWAKRREERVYFCHACLGFHLTSQPPRASEQAEAS